MKITIIPLGQDNWTWCLDINGAAIEPVEVSYNRNSDAVRGCYRFIAATWNEMSPAWTWRDVRTKLRMQQGIVPEVRRR